MADAGRSPLYRILDYAALGCILFGTEEPLRYATQMGKTSPWQAWVLAWLFGIGLSYVGDYGSKVWRRLLNWFEAPKTLKHARAEIERLRSEHSTGIPTADRGKAEPPDLRVRYDANGPRPKLVFSTSSPVPITITKIGELISEELYRCEHDLGLLQNVHPDVEHRRPLECQMSGEPLKTLLKAGGPRTSDFVAIEYSDANGNYSATFYLHKNPDGSIVWTNKPTEGVLNLDSLRKSSDFYDPPIRSSFRQEN
ncbi:MAG: hypothetical protein ACR2JB_27975 [Bryobacteraceae bacterium]